MCSLSSKVVRWFRKEARPLPWRDTADPYKIWICEMMCQQTGVNTVMPYYERFLKSFPDVESLARASEEDVLKLWEGLGYYSRARNLHRAAKLVVKEFDGRLPKTREEILKLPGVGEYSAGAILAIAYSKPEAALDGNLIRVYSRYFGIYEPVDETKTLKRLWQIARENLPEKREDLRDFTEGMMDLGATICKPKQPRCSNCPLESECIANRRKIQSSIPIKSKQTKRHHLKESIFLSEDAEGVALLPKGSDEKYPYFHRLPFLPEWSSLRFGSTLASKERYSVTNRTFEVLVIHGGLPEPLLSKVEWVPHFKLQTLMLPAIDRRVLARFSSQDLKGVS